MKKTVYIAIASVAAALVLSSCQFKDIDRYPSYYANAVVTVKHTPVGEMYFQLDDYTTVLPENLKKSPFGDKQVRAICNIELSDEKGTGSEGTVFDKTAKVNWIDSIRTKDIVQSLGSDELDDEKWGTDPIDIIDNFVTVVEDGYITLSFCALWGNPSIPHAINLVSGVDPDDPYTLEFRHDANEDLYHVGATAGTGIVAFNLGSLPDTGTETVDLKIRFRSLTYGGERTATFKYCSQKGILYMVNADEDTKNLVSSQYID